MEDLSNISEDAEELQNTAGVVSPILEFTPDEGLAFILSNAAARGRSPGIPIYAKLYDSNGDLLPLGTSVRIEYESPGADERRKVSEVRDNLQPYNNLSITEQQDEEFVDAVKIPLLGNELEVRDVDSFFISIESSAVIDWSNSQLFIEGSVVEEVQMP
jgi:hypothetical protein